MKRVSVLISLAYVFCALAAVAQGQKAVRPWEPFEVGMTAATEFSNAYVEAMPDSGKPYVEVTFNGTSGEARGLRFVVAGFWDGGKTWKARFAPPAPGVWSYSSSSGDTGLAGAKGSFQCTAWTEAEKAETRRVMVSSE